MYGACGYQGVILLTVSVSELYVDSFIVRQVWRRSVSDLSKRPSNQSLIHFYKRCVSLLFSPGSPGLMLSEGLHDSPLIVRVISLSNIHSEEPFINISPGHAF